MNNLSSTRLVFLRAFFFFFLICHNPLVFLMFEALCQLFFTRLWHFIVSQFCYSELSPLSNYYFDNCHAHRFKCIFFHINQEKSMFEFWPKFIVNILFRIVKTNLKYFHMFFLKFFYRVFWKIIEIHKEKFKKNYFAYLKLKKNDTTNNNKKIYLKKMFFENWFLKWCTLKKKTIFNGREGLVV